MTLPLTHGWRMPALSAAAALSLGLAACGGGGGASRAAADPAGTTMPGMSMPAGSAGGGPGAGPAVATTTVTITNFAFTPAAITVKAGTTVTWTNKDEEPHTVFSAEAGMKSPVLGNASTTYSHAFSAPGTYTYHCTIHPYMHGTVVVTA